MRKRLKTITEKMLRLFRDFSVSLFLKSPAIKIVLYRVERRQNCTMKILATFFFFFADHIHKARKPLFKTRPAPFENFLGFFLGFTRSQRLLVDKKLYDVISISNRIDPNISR